MQASWWMLTAGFVWAIIGSSAHCQESAILSVDGGVVHLAVARDSRHIAVASPREIRVWRVKDWNLVRTVSRDDSVLLLEFSTDNKSLVIASRTVRGGEPPVPCQLEWHDFVAGKTSKTKFIPNAPYAVAPDRFVAFATGPERHRIAIRDLESDETHTIEVANASFDRILFSPDGKRLGILDTNTRVASIWDSASGKVITKLQAQENVNRLFFPADGKTVYTYAPFHLRGWDIATGKELFGSAADVHELLPDGRIGLRLDTTNFAKKVEMAFHQVTGAGKVLARIDLGGGKSVIPTRIAVTPDQAYVIAACADKIRVWEIPSFKK